VRAVKQTTPTANFNFVAKLFYKVGEYIDTSFTRRNIRRSRLSIVDNIDNFKMPLIDGAETAPTVLNKSKIRFTKLPVILIMFGRKKYMLLRIYVGLSMSVTLKFPSRSIPNIPQVVFDF
jgi:hypothetical protein